MRVNFLDGVEDFIVALFRDVLQWGQEEVSVLSAKVRSAVRDRNVHSMFNIPVVTGQNPS